MANRIPRLRTHPTDEFFDYMGNAFAGINVTQEFLALGPVPGAPVTVDPQFTFTGVLGFTGDGSVAMTLEVRGYTVNAAPVTLFSGGLELDAGGIGAGRSLS